MLELVNIHIGKIQLEGYSSRSKYLDFVSITNMDTAYGKFGGTSCATPVHQGMVQLVRQFYKAKIGRYPTNAEVYAFIKDNCDDLDVSGHDKNTGYGLFRLPDPSKIDIDKYVGDNMKKRIVLKIDSKLAIVNDKAKILDVAPIIENERTLVPVRFIAEELGCKVKWNAESREVIIEK